MKDENNNLGDFFRKRLSSLEDGEEDWFNPDPRADDMVLQGLVASSNKKKSKKKGFFILLLCLLFLGMLSYIIHLKQHITSLNDTATNILAQKTFTPPTSTTTTENTTTLDHTSVPKHENTPNNPKTPIDPIASKNQEKDLLWSNLKKENQVLQQLLQEKNKKIQALELELSTNCTSPNSFEATLANNKTTEFKYLYPSLNAESILANEAQTTLGSKNLFSENKLNDFLSSSAPKEIALEELPKFKDLAVIEPELLAVPIEETEPLSNYAFALKNKKKRTRKTLELGVHVGLEGLITQKRIGIPNQRIIAKEEVAAEQFPVPYVGFDIAYSPLKNLWIRIGAQGGGSSNSLREQMGIVYNDANEYLLPSGDRGSDLLLNVATGYTEISNTLEVTVPNTTTNGDLLELEYIEEVYLKYLQIPLSVEYHFGSKKFQPFIHLGTKWNLFQYEYKTSSINLEANSQALDFNFKENESNIKEIQYMSLMTGVGMSCNLRPRLAIRATLGFEMNYLLNEEVSTMPYSKNGVWGNFGLHYKF